MLAALILFVAALAHAVAPNPAAEPEVRPVIADTIETARVEATYADAGQIGADTVIVEEPQPEPAVEEAPVIEAVTVSEATTLIEPVRYISAATGLSVVLPLGWEGEAAVTESDLPAYARYAFTNVASGSPLAGVTLYVEQVVGLNALDQQRWTRGLTPYGYHGLQPVGPASVPLPGLGIEVAGPGAAGAVAFVQRGQTFWAVHVQAPEAVWAARRPEMVALLGAVQFP